MALWSGGLRMVFADILHANVFERSVWKSSKSMFDAHNYGRVNVNIFLFWP